MTLDLEKIWTTLVHMKEWYNEKHHVLDASPFLAFERERRGQERDQLFGSGSD